MTTAPFAAERNSKFESWLVEKICKPALERIPESVHPNTLSLLNTVVAWTVFALAFVSTRVDAGARVAILLAAGVGMFGTMVLDCLDGMQARRTNRTSKLGEMLDHWLDGIHVPLASGGMVFALQLDPWAVVLVHVSNSMVYNAQLVLYHHKGKFVYTPTSGTDAQFGTAIILAAIGIFYYFVPPESPSSIWSRYAIAAACVLAIYVALDACRFYYVRLGRLVLWHLPFVALASAFGALYAVHVIDALPFVLLVVFLSFRITGSFVLFTIIGRRFGGFDLGIAAFVVAIGVVHFGLAPAPTHLAGIAITNALAYLACGYMVGRNLFDFVRHFGALRPRR